MSDKNSQSEAGLDDGAQLDSLSILRAGLAKDAEERKARNLPDPLDVAARKSPRPAPRNGKEAEEFFLGDGWNPETGRYENPPSVDLGGRQHTTIYNGEEFAALTFPEIQWAVDGLLPQGLTLFAGPPKKGKSRVCFNLAFAIATGGVALGTIPVEQGDVLYISLDDPKRRVHQWFIAACKQAGIAPPKNFHFAFDWPRIGDGCEERIEAWLKEHPAGRLVVLDVLEKVRPESKSRNPNIYKDDYKVGDALKPIADRYPAAILVPHHANKSVYRIGAGDDPMGAVLGSTGLAGGFDNCWVLYSKVGCADAFLHARGNDMEPFDKGLLWDNEAESWRIGGDAADFSGTTEWQQYRALFQDHGALSPIEVTRLLYPEADSKSQEHNKVRQRLHTYVKAGKIDKRRFDGRYCLLDNTTYRNTRNTDNSSNSRNTSNTHDNSAGVTGDNTDRNTKNVDGSRADGQSVTSVTGVTITGDNTTERQDIGADPVPPSNDGYGDSLADYQFIPPDDDPEAPDAKHLGSGQRLVLLDKRGGQFKVRWPDGIKTWLDGDELSLGPAMLEIWGTGP